MSVRMPVARTVYLTSVPLLSVVVGLLLVFRYASLQRQAVKAEAQELVGLRAICRVSPGPSFLIVLSRQRPERLYIVDQQRPQSITSTQPFPPDLVSLPHDDGSQLSSFGSSSPCPRRPTLLRRFPARS